MLNLDKIYNVYFLGVGGIGMSAMARYFNALGKRVGGYDKVSRPITDRLKDEGIAVNFSDDVDSIPASFKTKENTLVVITPAVPTSSNQRNYFIQQGFEVKKRAEVLGMVANTKHGIAIAGTHGKTTITTMVSYFMQQSRIGCNAFLGGISKNFKTNLVVDSASEMVVVEADEYDRSFLHLKPDCAVISAIDADHLDIYNDKDSVKDAFRQFVQQIKPGGTLILKSGIDLITDRDDLRIYTYSLQGDSDFRAENVRVEDGLYRFDFIGKEVSIENLRLGLPGRINVENAVAAIATAWLNGVHQDEIFNAVPKFRGIERRFDYQVYRNDFVYIDDYAHHPEELKATIASVRELFRNKRITGIFQPHLFSRTRDFAEAFAQSLDLLDEIILLDIYPAREEPIPGVTSEIIYHKIKKQEKILCTRNEVTGLLKTKKPEVLITLGAGDIDELVQPIKKMFE
ncbi:MAG: UDP-N-acetylmuramate--L-alanine ligase [Bacteroidales bacterium]|jgi:UDP-N-acetylmuramate--alanine ligase|nr:UDP-N-acetylmuramate--L-alanine ligase [Bacteroidales bacterium]